MIQPPRRILFATTCRSDFGPSVALLRAINASSELELGLLVGGAHLSAEHGLTTREVEAEGLPIVRHMDFLSPDLSASAAKAMWLYATCFAEESADLLMLYGDRWELLTIATAATMKGLPILHLCGGDVTEGAIDEQVRHAVTKLAHLHVPSTPGSAARLRHMGEEPWRILAVGDPAVDRFREADVASDADLHELVGFVPDRSTLLVTWHPTTNELPELASHTEALIQALAAWLAIANTNQVIITAPAPDPGAEQIRTTLEAFAKAHPERAVFVESLGSRAYRRAMGLVGALVGNSSSALNEAPYVSLGAVNIGTRQQGRERGLNVIDVAPDADAIGAGIARATSATFRASLSAMQSPYGDGHVSQRVVRALEELPPREVLLRKRFFPPSQTDAATRKPIGGDFPLVSIVATSPALFATGRDALAAIVLKHPDAQRWLVPEFTCPTVVELLRAHGKTTVPLAMTEPWLPDLTSLREAQADAVMVPFFLGASPTEELWQALQGSSMLVVEDRCQVASLPPSPDELRGDYAVGSYRKWLPVVDGAYCITKRGSALHATGGDLGAAALSRIAGAAIKSIRDTQGRLDPWREEAMVDLFREGEALLGAPLEPRRAQFITEAVLETLDIGAVQRKRAENLTRLLTHLERLGITALVPEPERCTTLLALPIRLSNRDTIRAQLSSEHIYCPVHWPGGDWSGTSPKARQWAAELLSLPIDHRLDAADIDRMAAALEHALRTA